jgi:hypothetical protein
LFILGTLLIIVEIRFWPILVGVVLGWSGMAFWLGNPRLGSIPF